MSPCILVGTVNYWDPAGTTQDRKTSESGLKKIPNMMVSIKCIKNFKYEISGVPYPP